MRSIKLHVSVGWGLWRMGLSKSNKMVGSSEGSKGLSRKDAILFETKKMKFEEISWDLLKSCLSLGRSLKGSSNKENMDRKQKKEVLP